MRIAFFVHHFPLLSESFIMNQIIGLIARGHNVDIYATEPSTFQKVHIEIDRFRLMERTRYLRKMPRNYFLRILKAIGLIVGNYGWLRPMVLVMAMNVLRYGRGAASLSLLYDAISLLWQKPYDVIHCQFGTLGLNALRLRQIGVLTGKLVTSFRGSDATKHLQNKPGIYDELFREGDLFFPVSQSLRQRLIEAGCDERKIIVQRSGIDCTKFRYREHQRAEGEATNVLTIARLVEKKGVAYAIQAAARLLASGRRINYAIVGDGVLRGDLERLIKDLGVRANVRLLGGMNNDEVIRLLQSSHVLVAPSVTSVEGEQEGIPNALKEAMAMGLPVVSTLHSGIPELVEDGVSGFLVPERNVDSLTDRLAYLIDHPERWPEMGHAGRKYVEKNYDINIMNDNLVELYQRILEGKLP